jgi:uncharacterized membrane protein
MIHYHAIAQVLDAIALLFQLVGVIALVTGTVLALYRFFVSFKQRSRISIDQIRLYIGQSIVLSLELFVAGDIIKTIVTPDYYDIGILAILVIIRTIITYFLNQELSHLNKAAIPRS